jgi:hypothetical protein
MRQLLLIFARNLPGSRERPQCPDLDESVIPPRKRRTFDLFLDHALALFRIQVSLAILTIRRISNSRKNIVPYIGKRAEHMFGISGA